MPLITRSDFKAIGKLLIGCLIMGGITDSIIEAFCICMLLFWIWRSSMNYFLFAWLFGPPLGRLRGTGGDIIIFLLVALVPLCFIIAYTGETE